MSKNNDVFQVLVTKNNKAVLAKGKGLNDLLEGQIGFFDNDTNLSVDSFANVKEFYIAVNSENDNFNFSAGGKGGLIKKELIKKVDKKNYVAPLSQIIEISNIKAKCDTEYAIKLEFKNQRAYRLQGYLPFSHTYAVKTACCDTCDECPSGDCNELIKLFVNAINADEKKLVVAEFVGKDSSGKDKIMTDVEFDAFIKSSKSKNIDDDETNDVCGKIRLTSVPTEINKFCNVNTKYYKVRENSMVVSFVERFGCNGKIEEIQEAVLEEGNGYNIKQKEYIAGGWNGKPGPYRTLQLTGLANEGFEYYAELNEKYDQTILSYDSKETGGWLEYTNNLSTIIAVSKSDTVTASSLNTILLTL